MPYIVVFVIFLVVLGIITEGVRSLFLKDRHDMTLEEYYRRKHRGEDVPKL